MMKVKEFFRLVTTDKATSLSSYALDPVHAPVAPANDTDNTRFNGVTNDGFDDGPSTTSTSNVDETKGSHSKDVQLLAFTIPVDKTNYLAQDSGFKNLALSVQEEGEHFVDEENKQSSGRWKQGQEVNSKTGNTTRLVNVWSVRDGLYNLSSGAESPRTIHNVDESGRNTFNEKPSRLTSREGTQTFHAKYRDVNDVSNKTSSMERVKQGGIILISKKRRGVDGLPDEGDATPVFENHDVNGSKDKPSSREITKDNDKHPDIDGGWSYVIALAVFLVAFIHDGPKNSFGILLPNLQRDFNSGVASISFSAGVLDGTWMAVGPFAANMVKRFGCRPVALLGSVIACTGLALSTLATNVETFIVFYGVLAGIGIGLFYLPAMTIVNLYFQKKRGLVLGFVTSGSGVGLLVMSLVIERLIDFLGWRGAYLIVAGFYLQICICATLMRPLTPWSTGMTADDVMKSEMEGIEEDGSGNNNICLIYQFDEEQIIAPNAKGENIDKGDNSSITKSPTTSYSKINSKDESVVNDQPSPSPAKNDAPSSEMDVDSPRSLLKDPRFLIFCLTAFLLQLTNNIAPMFYPSYAESMGIDSARTARIVSVFGISNTLGRFTTGLLSQLGINNLLLYSAGTSLTGVLYFLIPFYTTYESLLASAAGQGFFIGAFPPLQSVILVELLGLERLPYTFGIMTFCKSVGSIAGPTLSGSLYQVAQDYTLPFVFAGSILIVANILHILLAVLKRRKSKRSQEIP